MKTGIQLIVLCTFFLMLYSCGPRWKYIHPDPINIESNDYKITAKVSLKFIDLDIKNKSKNTLKIVWDDSAFVNNGNSGQLMPMGTKFIDAKSKKPDLVIPSGTSVRASCTPADGVYWDKYIKDWVINPIEPGINVLTLALKNGDKQESVNFDIIIKVKKESE